MIENAPGQGCLTLTLKQGQIPIRKVHVDILSPRVQIGWKSQELRQGSSQKRVKISGAKKDGWGLLVPSRGIWHGRTSNNQLGKFCDQIWLVEVFQPRKIPKSSLTETSVSWGWEEMKEDFWYPRGAFGRAVILAPVPSPGATKRQQPKSRSDRVKLDLAWNNLIGYEFQGYSQRDNNRKDFSRIGSVQIGSLEINRLWSPRKNLNFFLLWWFLWYFGVLIFGVFIN